MAQQDVRYYLNGLLIESEGTKLRAVATDGHRLAVSDIDLAESLLKINRKTLLKIEEIVSLSSRKNIKSRQIQNLIESLIESETLFCDERKKILSQKLDIIKRLVLIRHEYQVSTFSIKFFSQAFKKIINLVKRDHL